MRGVPYLALSQVCVDRVKTRHQAGVLESGRTQTRRENIPVGSTAASMPPTVCFSSTTPALVSHVLAQR